jgi:hypothetical protein
MPTFDALPRPVGATVLILLLATAALTVPAGAVAAPGPAPLKVTPSPVAFSAVTVGEQGSIQVEILNEGEDAAIEKIAIEGGDAGDFSVSGNSCGALVEGGACAVTVNFVPGSAGEKHATAWIRFSGGRAEESFELVGAGVPAHLSFQPPGHDFGLVPVNSGSTGTTLEVENDGQAATRVNSFSWEGFVEGFWFNGPSDCPGRLLQPGQSCSIPVSFGPSEARPYAATLRVDVTGASFTAEINGEGVRPEVEVTPNPVQFGALTAGSGEAVRTLAVTNTGRIPIGFFIAVIAGGDAGSFQLLDEDCTGVELQPGEGCNLEVRFAPRSAGPKAATLAMFGDGEGGMPVALRGEGLPAAVTLAPSGRDFGHQALGTRSAPQAFAVRNEGGGPLALDTATIAGADSDQFAISADACTGMTLAPGGQCMIEVRFVPDSSGPKAAVLRVGGDGGPLKASLSGTGDTGTATTARVSFHWRGTSRSLRGGAALRVGSARCSAADRCAVRVTAKLHVVRRPRAGLLETQVANLPSMWIEIGASRAHPLEVRLPVALRGLLERGRATLSLKAGWRADGEAGSSVYDATVR